MLEAVPAVAGKFWAIAALARLLRNSVHGGIAMTFALSLPVLMGALGVASDYAMMTKVQNDLQVAADAAAIAGAREIPLANSKASQVLSSVKAFAAYRLRNNPEKSDDDLAAGNLTMTVEVVDDFSAVDVHISEAWRPFFLHFIDESITPITVHAKARFVGVNNVCVLTLDPSGSKALHLDKSAQINANNCGIYSDSTDAQGIRLDMDSSVKAKLICSAGGVKAKSTAIDPQPITDCPAVPDPLASRPAPAVGGCDYDKMNIKNENRTLSPGVYCGGLKIDGTSVVNFEPGTYIIKDGPFIVTGSAAAHGANVGFYLSGDKSLLDFNSNTTIDFSGAVSGAMAGLLFFEDRSAPFGRKHRINSANAQQLTGTIYLPNGMLRIDPNSAVAAESAYTAIVSYQLELSEGPELILNTDYSSTQVPVPAGISGTSQVVLSD